MDDNSQLLERRLRDLALVEDDSDWSDVLRRTRMSDSSAVSAQGHQGRRRKSTSDLRSLVAGLGALIVIGVATAIIAVNLPSSGAGADKPLTTRSFAARTAPVGDRSSTNAASRSQGNASSLTAHFVVLRSTRPHPSLANIKTAQAMLAKLRSDPSAATTVVFGSDTVAIMAGSAITCLHVTTPYGGNGSCGDTASGPTPVEEDGLYGVETRSLIVGGAVESVTHQLQALVPDGNTFVTLVRTDGTTTAVPVVDNVVLATLPNANPVTEIKYVSASGATFVGPLIYRNTSPLVSTLTHR